MSSFVSSSLSTAPRLTIGLPVYNGERFLPAALDSLLAQSFTDFELLINDNCSTDRTAEIASAYAARDPRVRVRKQPRNLGVTANYWSLVENARGELFRWAAVDDLCEPTAIEACVNVLAADADVVLAYTRAQFIEEAGGPHPDWADYVDGLHLDSPSASQRFKDCFKHVGMCNPMYGVIRTSILRRTRGMGAYMGSDIVLLAELALNGRFYEVSDRLFLRRIHPEALSSKSNGDQLPHFAPGTAERVFMREWRHLWELWRGIVHAPIAVSEKARATAFLSRRGRWNRDLLARELWRRASDIIASPMLHPHRRKSV